MNHKAGEKADAAAASGDRTPRGPFVGRLTAEGRGAIAVVRVWGPRAIEVSDSVFRPDRGARLADCPRGVLRLGHIGHGLGDEVVAVVLEVEPPAVEVQCHGGPATVALVVETLRNAGAKSADPAGPVALSEADPFAARARLDLARAPTVKTAEILIDQMQGALRDALARLGGLIDIQPVRALSELDTLIGRGHVGLRLLSGWRIAIVGRPNVGKSRLFNALVGFARAIVDPTPGTTRDVVSFTVSLAGWPVELADTAGLRQTFDPVESMGIERSWREQERADLNILVVDRSVYLEPIDLELIATNPHAIVVGNKSDLPAAWQKDDRRLLAYPIVTVSATTGDGLDRLIETIVGRLVPDPPSNGVAVPFRQDQIDRLREVRDSLFAGDRPEAAGRLALMIDGRDDQSG
jgi:tRNA modification GTPase